MQRKNTQSSKLPAHFAELVRLFPPQAIHDDIGYANTLKMIDRLTSLAKPTAGQIEFLETLTILFEAYEGEHERIRTSYLSPSDVLDFLLKSNDLNGSDLGRLLGNRELGSKLLNGTRHIRRLAERFKVDAGLFL